MAKKESFKEYFWELELDKTEGDIIYNGVSVIHLKRMKEAEVTADEFEELLVSISAGLKNPEKAESIVLQKFDDWHQEEGRSEEEVKQYSRSLLARLQAAGIVMVYRKDLEYEIEG